jgi:beta-phosphoglucomutase-like phosphatase (HAD superfamily)
MNKIIPVQDIPAYLTAHHVRGIIFDIDGTLLDTMPMWSRLGSRYLRSKNIPPEDNLDALLFPMTLTESTAYLKEHYHLRQSPAEIRQGLHEIMADFYRYEAPLKEGAYELLNRLHQAGFPMVLATAGEKDLEEAALQRVHVLSFFRKMFLCEDCGTTKKEAVIDHAASSYMHTRPEETLVVEDMYQALAAAWRDGFQTASVFDQASASDQDRIRKVSVYHLPDFHCMEILK